MRQGVPSRRSVWRESANSHYSLGQQQPNTCRDGVGKTTGPPTPRLHIVMEDRTRKHYVESSSSHVFTHTAGEGITIQRMPIRVKNPSPRANTAAG